MERAVLARLPKFVNVQWALMESLLRACNLQEHPESLGREACIAFRVEASNDAHALVRELCASLLRTAARPVFLTC